MNAVDGGSVGGVGDAVKKESVLSGWDMRSEQGLKNGSFRAEVKRSNRIRGRRLGV